jgi:hypothetical protein
MSRNTARRVPKVHLAAVVGGGDSILMSHLIEHYRGLGIESFYLTRHAESRDDPAYEEIEYYARAAGVKLFHTHLGPWDDNLHGRLMTAAMGENPDDWYAVVDLDELHMYDRPLPDLIELCERGGYEHVCGCFVDRIGPDGTLPEVGADSLWEQYPWGGSVTSRLIGAPTVKNCLMRGRTGVGGGHHGIPGATGLPRALSYVQVHHFKWTGSLVRRMRRRVQRYDSGEWTLVYPSVLEEARRVVHHLDRNGGRIDVGDERLMLGRCGSEYHETTRWPEIARDAQRWQWIMQGHFTT